MNENENSEKNELNNMIMSSGNENNAIGCVCKTFFFSHSHNLSYSMVDVFCFHYYITFGVILTVFFRSLAALVSWTN